MEDQMARPETTGQMTGSREEADAYSLDEFARRHGFSPKTLYKNKHLMPDCFWVGNRRLVSREAAARWRAEREKEASDMES
jgi:hypothetical protein